MKKKKFLSKIVQGTYIKIETRDLLVSQARAAQISITALASSVLDKWAEDIELAKAKHLIGQKGGKTGDGQEKGKSLS